MPIKMKNLPVTERPYEKLEQYGEKNLTNAELLAIIIKSGTREETSVQLAQKILLLNENRDKNNLNFLRDITIEELRKKVEDLKIIACNNSVCHFMTISAGLGNILKVAPNINSESIYDEVDKLLYMSKERGRNKITVKDIIV